MYDANILREILDSQFELVCRFTRDGTIRFVNRAYAETLASTPAELTGRNLWEFVTPEDRLHVETQIDLLSPERRTMLIENRFETAAGTRWTLWRNVAIAFDADGLWQEAQASGYDITERKQLEEQRELLIAELNHRVRNTLMVVQGLAHQTFKGDDMPASRLAVFNSRLHALAGAHSALSRNNWGGADLAMLVEEALSINVGDMDRIDRTGPHIQLPQGAVVALVLVLHELATNAIKYGALSNDEGRIVLNWDIPTGPDGAQRIDLLWKESGGPPVTPPSATGFGSRLISSSVRHQLGGDLDLAYSSDGLSCRMSFPLRAGAA